MSPYTTACAKCQAYSITQSLVREGHDRQFLDDADLCLIDKHDCLVSIHHFLPTTFYTVVDTCMVLVLFCSLLFSAVCHTVSCHPRSFYPILLTGGRSRRRAHHKHLGTRLVVQQYPRPLCCRVVRWVFICSTSGERER